MKIFKFLVIDMLPLIYNTIDSIQSSIINRIFGPILGTIISLSLLMIGLYNFLKKILH